MITGVPNTGFVVNQMLHQVPSNDIDVFAHLPTNGRGPKPSTGNISLVSFIGGPLIRLLKDGTAQVTQYGNRGYNALISPPLLIPINETINVNQTAQTALVHTAVGTAFGGMF